VGQGRAFSTSSDSVIDLDTEEDGIVAASLTELLTSGKLD